MKQTGIIRKVDELGRIVIPSEIRNTFNIRERDELEIFINSSSIILKKYEPTCTFCGSTKNLVEFNNKLICEKCSKEIAELTNKDTTAKK